MNELGLIYVFTGNGKGKTSAALGTAVRALSHGWTVSWVAFYKEASWGISEYSLIEGFIPTWKKRFSMHLLGKGFYIQTPEQEVKNAGGSVKVATVGQANKVIDDNTAAEHRAAAHAALAKAQEILSTHPDVLILDEACNALDDKLITWKELQNVLDQRQKTHIVLTGRSAKKVLIEYADLVSEIKKVKHPYDQGELAVQGLDF